MNFFRYRGTLFQQVSFVFVMFTIIPLIVLGWFQYVVSSDVIMKNNAIMLGNIMGQSRQHLEALFVEVDRTHLNVIDSKDIADLLSKEPSNVGEETLFVSMLLQLLSSIKTTVDIKQVSWYPSNPDAYPLYNGWVMSRNYMNKAWYQDSRLREGKPVWGIEDYPAQFYGTESETVVTQYRMLKNKSTLEPLGFIGVSISVPKLRSHLLLSTNLKNQRLMLIDEQGTVIADTFAREKKPSEFDFLQHTSYNDSSEWVTNRGDRYFVSHTSMTDPHWRLLSIIPEGTLIGSMQVIRNTIIGLLISYILLGGCLAFYLFIKITKPVTDLAAWMKQVDAGNLVLVPHLHKGSGEIPFLFRRFQNLVYRLKEQIGQIYESEKKKKELEFAALNYQIRPHFLYNTLDVIKWKASKGKHTDVVNMIESLSGMLRATIHGNSFVTVKQEMEQVKYYVEIEQFRQQNRFVVLYDIDDRVLDVEIPTLLIQPLVENAIRHGVLSTDLEGFILVKIFKEDNSELFIEVLDNGPGFPQPYVLGEASAAPKEAGGIGLQNIRKRLELYYGEQQRLEWGRTPSEETFVRIRMGSLEHNRI